MTGEGGDQAIVKPISVESVPWETWAEGVRFGTRFKHLTKAAGVQNHHVGFAVEEIAPGKQSVPAHYHMHEEEHIFVLEGQVTLRLGDERFELKPGDYVCFPAGQRAGHCLVNTGASVCRFIIVGEDKPNEVCVYTDTNKVSVRSLGRGHIFNKSATLDYWADERKDEPL
jgi:uncharacterized cupin superfamily protein